MYTNLVLGSFSPIHFRSLSAVIGLCCVGLAVTSGYGIALAFG